MAEWSEGVVSNMAREPKGNDRAQILAVAAGEADIAVANTYYLALMLSGNKGPEQQAAAKKVKPFFPNQNDRGTHMNISGAGLVKGAPNKANAVKLVEFLLSKEAQEHIVNNTFEYPMTAGVSPHPLVVNMGLDFKQDLKTKVANYGKKQADALEVMTGAGWKQTSLLIKMRHTNKKELNLNKIKTGCVPCFNEALKMQQKLSDRDISKIKIEEIKKIVSSLFKKD